MFKTSQKSIYLFKVCIKILTLLTRLRTAKYLLGFIPLGITSVSNWNSIILLKQN